MIDIVMPSLWLSLFRMNDNFDHGDVNDDDEDGHGDGNDDHDDDEEEEDSTSVGRRSWVLWLSREAV